MLLLIFLILQGLHASFVKFHGCLTPQAHVTRLKQLENIEKPTESDAKRFLKMARRRGPFKFMVGQHIAMTVQSCIQRCWIYRFDYAGLQNGDKCYCGMSTKGLATLNRSYCYSRCSGNCRQFCGGRVTMTVYKTGYEKEPTFNGWNMKNGAKLCREHRPDAQACQSKQMKDLFSFRMSAPMCVTYCFSHHMPMAAFKDDKTCCCPSKTTNGLYSHLHSLGQCQKQCFDSAVTAPCYGKVNGRFTTLIYDSRDLNIYKRMTFKPILDYHGGSLLPAFPPNMTFEEDIYQPVYVPPNRGPAKLGMGAMLSNHSNATATTEDRDFTPWIISSLVLCFVLAIFIAVGNIFHKRNLSPEIFKLPDEIEMNIPDEDEDEESDRKRKSKKKKKKAKEKRKHKRKDKRKDKRKETKPKDGKRPEKGKDQSRNSAIVNLGDDWSDSDDCSQNSLLCYYHNGCKEDSHWKIVRFEDI